MMDLLDNDAQKVLRDGKVVYRMEMDYEDFLRFTSGDNDDGSDAKKDDVVANQYDKSDVGTENIEEADDWMGTRKIDARLGKIYSEKVKLREHVGVGVGDEKRTNEELYSRLIEEEMDLNFLKYKARESELKLKRDQMTTGSKLVPMSMLDSHNYTSGGSTGSKYLDIIHDKQDKRGDIDLIDHEQVTLLRAMKNAYIVNDDDNLLKSSKHRWLRTIQFKMKEIDKETQSGFSFLFLLGAISTTALCKIFAESCIFLMKRSIGKFWCFQKKRFMLLKFVVVVMIFLRVLYFDFFDTEETKT